LKRSQSVLDALADAETLRLFWQQHGTYNDTFHGPEWTPFTPKVTVVADYLARGGRQDVSCLEDARAAFRAVPALRAAQQEGQ
jgi:hypothetical protein